MTAFGTAIAALVAAVLLRWLLDPLIGDTLPLVTLFGAVAVAVWVGGYRPALLVAALGYVACEYLFIAPRATFGPIDVQKVVGAVAYAFTCALIIGIGEAMRAARLRASERGELMRVTLRSIGDAVIASDNEGRITYVNAVAESLTGWAQADALHQPLNKVFRIVDPRTRKPLENPSTRALRDDTVIGPNDVILVGRDGVERPIDDSASPIKDERGAVSGSVLVFRDISERLNWETDAAGRLRAARLLASIVESSDDAIISKTLEGIIESWNAAAERVFGYTAKEAVGRHISLVIPQDRLDEEDRIIASLKAGQRVDHYETERVRSDGRRILVSLTISPIRDEAGNVVGASKIARDVTRQRQAEERERRLLAEAAAANAKFRAFFEQGALFAGIVDLDGMVLEMNRPSWEGCGYTKAQAVGTRLWDGPWWTQSAPLAERIRLGYDEAKAGRTFRAELPYFVADGSEREVDLVILPIKDDAGRILFLALTGTDITDRTRAEAEREKFVTLVENSTDFIGISDLEGMPMYVNPAGLKLVGLDGMEQARRTPVRDFFFPEDQSKIIDDFFPSVSESGHSEIEIRFRNFRTGEARWMDYKVLKLADGGGQTVAFATVSRDITERKHLEDNLRKLASDLSEADHRKDEFLATLAHELRNPLAPLRNTLEILKRSGGSPEKIPHALGTMERQLKQLVRLVDDLLDLNRITHDRIELRKERVDLVALLREVIEGMRSLAETAGHDLRIAVPRDPIYVHADEVRLAQVFGNLLNNSFKYTGRGGRISVSVERGAREAVVAIRDNGIGIPPDQLKSIFDMFNQVDRTIERSKGGLGIGLALVKRLVQMHGGSVEARSEGENQGSEFVVRLPIAIADAATPSGEKAAAHPATHAHRILVVDDNRDAAGSLATLLQITGHETFTAHDGPSALAMIEQRHPDVVLLDIGLPRLNGFEVCRRARELPLGHDVTMIALTGWGQEEDRRKSQEAGFDGHLVKPVEFSTLMTLLDSLTAEKQVR